MRLEIVQDNDYSLDDLLGDPLLEVAYLKHSRYTLGTKGVSYEEMDDIRDDKSMFKLPVYAYIHSGVCLSTGPFGDIFDSGRSGFVYADKKYLASELGHKKWNQHTKRKAIAAAESLVETVSLVLEGEVYSYQVINDDGDVVDSCCGFIGEEHAREEGLRALAAYQC